MNPNQERTERERRDGTAWRITRSCLLSAQPERIQGAEAEKGSPVLTTRGSAPRGTDRVRPFRVSDWNKAAFPARSNVNVVIQKIVMIRNIEKDSGEEETSTKSYPK